MDLRMEIKPFGLEDAEHFLKPKKVPKFDWKAANDCFRLKKVLKVSVVFCPTYYFVKTVNFKLQIMLAFCPGANGQFHGLSAGGAAEDVHGFVFWDDDLVSNGVSNFVKHPI